MISAIVGAGLLAASPQPGANTFIFGIGSEACESAMAPDRSLERQVWIMGYWSGLNAANKTRTGKDTDVFQIFAGIERRCAASPTQTLMQVALDLWWAMQPKETA